MNPADLKRTLRALDGVPENYLSLSREMLAHLGSPDPELRDELIYRKLATWLFEGVFTPEESREVLATLQDDEHLFYKLGETGTDSVLCRSFSVLLIAPIVGRHREKAFLSAEEVAAVSRRVRMYLEGERDLRGYDPEKGWLHPVAHAADVLDELALCEEIGEAGLLALLESVQKAAFTGISVYAHGEDERLSHVVVNTAKRDILSEAQILAWLTSFKDKAPTLENFPMPESYHSFINIKHFLRTLYFSLLKDFGFLKSDSKEIKLRRVMLSEIERVLLELNKL